MKNKNLYRLLALGIIGTLLFSYQYLKVRKEYKDVQSKAKYEFANQCLNYYLINAYGMDINKINEKDKEATSSLINMYEYISKASEISYIFYKEDFYLVDPGDMGKYQRTLKEILNKATRDKLTDEDARKINLLTEDIKLIYKYIDENHNVNMKKYDTKIRPNLKLIREFE